MLGKPTKRLPIKFFFGQAPFLKWRIWYWTGIKSIRLSKLNVEFVLTTVDDRVKGSRVLYHHTAIIGHWNHRVWYQAYQLLTMLWKILQPHMSSMMTTARASAKYPLKMLISLLLVWLIKPQSHKNCYQETKRHERDGHRQHIIWVQERAKTGITLRNVIFLQFYHRCV